MEKFLKKVLDKSSKLWYNNNRKRENFKETAMRPCS